MPSSVSSDSKEKEVIWCRHTCAVRGYVLAGRSGREAVLCCFVERVHGGEVRSEGGGLSL